MDYRESGRDVKDRSSWETQIQTETFAITNYKIFSCERLVYHKPHMSRPVAPTSTLLSRPSTRNKMQNFFSEVFFTHGTSPFMIRIRKQNETHGHLYISNVFK